MTTDMKTALDALIAIGEYGTQMFVWIEPVDVTPGVFEYAIPLTPGGGGEFGGDTETYEAPELDLSYVAKIAGPSTLEDITLTSNYTKDRYKRWTEIISRTTARAYLEVFTDGSAFFYTGSAGMPRALSGDVRQIEVTIAPQAIVFIYDINDISEEEYELLKTHIDIPEVYVPGYSLPIDANSLPKQREEFFKGE